MIAVIGVDGCGKSTVIDRLRPALLPVAKSVQVIHSSSKPRQTAVIDNHALAPRSTAVALLKITWRAIQWSRRYRFHYRPLLLDGHIILCDRFYFDDILIDPLKYRYAGPLAPLRTLRRLVPHPDLYILLDAPERVLYARKQETSLAEVARQRRAFQELVHRMPFGHCVDASAPVEIVTQDALNIILGCLEERRHQRI